MAKNKSRSSKPAAQAKPKNAAPAGEASKSEASKAQTKQKEVLYQVKTKRDSGVLKAYITFTYRMLHPGVSARLMLYGLIVALPGIFFLRICTGRYSSPA